MRAHDDRKMSQAIRQKVYFRDRGRCYVCGEYVQVGDYECGHLHDRSRSGPTRLDNLVVMCGWCNELKPPHGSRDEAVRWCEERRPHGKAWMTAVGVGLAPRVPMPAPTRPASPAREDDRWARMTPDEERFYLGAFCPLGVVYAPDTESRSDAFHCVEGEIILEPGAPMPGRTRLLIPGDTPGCHERVIVAVPGPRPGVDQMPDELKRKLAVWAVRTARGTVARKAAKAAAERAAAP